MLKPRQQGHKKSMRLLSILSWKFFIPPVRLHQSSPSSSHGTDRPAARTGSYLLLFFLLILLLLLLIPRCLWSSSAAATPSPAVAPAAAYLCSHRSAATRYSCSSPAPWFLPPTTAWSGEVGGLLPPPFPCLLRRIPACCRVVSCAGAGQEARVHLGQGKVGRRQGILTT